mmetsp:Transcript_24561/g.47977  ORF Transcript_24561/g.47977 Transcript_24561/m.47977 type:complete len:87 (-) Transcript_24561:714-974(-)
MSKRRIRDLERLLRNTKRPLPEDVRKAKEKQLEQLKKEVGEKQKNASRVEKEKKLAKKVPLSEVHRATKNRAKTFESSCKTGENVF